MSRVVLAVLGFGLEPDHEPSKCNRRAARRAVRWTAKTGHQVVSVVSQWEPASDPAMLRALSPEVVVQPQPGVYLSSDPALEAAARLAHEYRADRVMVIANPILHWQLCALKLHKLGVKVLFAWPGWIGFNRHSAQYQDRSILHLMVYTVKEFRRGRLKTA